MPIINRQSFTALLPNGSTVKPISGTITLDEAWTPYVQADITVALPASLSPFDPRVTPVPRVVVTAVQEFTDSDAVSVFTAQFGGGTVAALTAAYGAGTIAAITAARNRPWKSGQSRRGPVRVFDLGIRSRTITPDNTLTISLASDEAILQDIAPVAGPPVNDEGPIGSGRIEGGSLGFVVTTILESIFTSPNIALITADANLTAFVDGPYSPGFPTSGIAWPAGVTAWDFLDTFVQIAGARLWCDESRVWHVTVAPDNTSDSIAIAASDNLTDFADEVSRDGEWFDAVVIRYKWTKTNGAPGIGYDNAILTPGDWSKTYVVDRDLGTQSNSFYPPAGAAALLLSQVGALGRRIDLTAVNDFAASPGAALTATLPGGTLTGRLASVAWSLETREMRVTTRNMS